MKKIIWIICCCLLALLLVIGCSAAQPIQAPSGQLALSINGEENVYLEYGNLFLDTGAEATYTDALDHSSISVPVETSGQVDCAKVGVYQIGYSAQIGEYMQTDYRNVHIVDTVSPVITLVTNPDAYTLPNEPYQEEGFTATDNYDGDLTAQVQSQEVNGEVIYTVTDSSGNSETIKRTIRYYDPTPPELYIEGSRIMVIMSGEDFTDPGCTASDKEDGDLTSAVTVSGSVDPDRAGVYTLSYCVADAFGNSVSDSRTVYVVSPQSSAEPNGKYIYLTFDDGPSDHTGWLLDILAKYNVKATFFVVGTGNIGIISRAAAEGHTVAIHTTTHNFAQIYSSDEAYLNDLLTMQEIISQYTGYKPTMFRFPGGSSNSVSRNYNIGIMSRLTKTLPEMGFQYYDWNVDSRDAGGASSSDEVFHNVITGIQKHNTSIVLQHDTQAFSVRAVEKIIAWGLSNGYTFLPLTPGSPTSHHGVCN